VIGQASDDLVTIIVPVYNGALRIASTLETLKSQTYRNWRCILVNDGSTDDSLKQINIFISSNPNLDISVITSENFGAGSARNLGLLESDSGFVAFLDQDDLWDTTKLEKQSNFLKANPDFNGVLCNFTISTFNNQSKLIASRIIRNKEIDRLVKGWLSLTGNGALMSSTFLFRRNEFTRDIFFDPQFSYVADIDYFLAFISSNKLAILNEPLVTYLQHGDQMHSDPKGLLIDYPKLLEKWDVSQFGLKKSELQGNMYALCLLLEIRKCNLKSAIRMLKFALITNRLSLIVIPVSVLKKRIISVLVRIIEGF
jgi:glycosyltransferase involved in cell wall biosynthesis